jgi:quercetin dioxygenase-like cupin family protein
MSGAVRTVKPASFADGRRLRDSGDWEDAEPGVRRRILVAQGRLMLMDVQFAAGAAGYEHQHSHEQISYCVSGRFEYSLDGRTDVLSTG